MSKISIASLAVLVFVVAAAFAGEQQFKQSLARLAQQRYDVAMRRAQAEYDAAVEKARREYIANLEKAAQLAEKGGDSDEAAAIVAERDAVLAELTGTPVEKKDAAEDMTFGFDWADVYKTPARITVAALEPVVLTAPGDDSQWRAIPKALLTHPAAIYSKKTGGDAGVADFKVTNAGYVVVACHYGYEGNTQGDWDEKRWTKKDFQQNGWTLLTEEQLGGPLVQKNGREYTLFVKKVDAGYSMRLRCNKYEPPLLIVFK